MEKIRLKHRLGIIIFCFSLASIFIFKMATVTVYADSSKVPVELHVTDNGDPLSNRAYEAYNLDEAYQKIVDGDIVYSNKQEPTILAAHFDGEEYTEDELKEIRQFAEFVKGKRR